MAKKEKVIVKVKKPKPFRPGVHAKSKTSQHAGSKNYSKPYNGQGRI